MAHKEIATDFTMLTGAAHAVAPLLLGALLERKINGHTVRVRIVETEAYDQTDAASHSYKGKTPRTEIMFGPAGHLYVYFTYGMHYCCNVVVGGEGQGAAVLIRAVEPVDELSRHILEERRGKTGAEALNGPAKLCQALGIDKAMNGHDLRAQPLRLMLQPALPKENIVVSPRIGISQAKDVMWRFYDKTSPYVSKL